MVVGSTDGSQESLGCVIYCFLMKFIDEKELVTDRPTDGRTDRRPDGQIWRCEESSKKLCLLEYNL